MAHFSPRCRSYAEPKGEGQGAHMVKTLAELFVGEGQMDVTTFLYFWESRRHQKKCLTSLITSSSLWGHRSFRTWTPLSLWATARRVKWWRKPQAPSPKPKPPLRPRPSCLSFRPPDSHVAVEVIVGGHRNDPMKSSESKPRGRTQDPGMAACALLK